MNQFPPLLFPLLCASLVFAVATLIFAALVISVSPVIWAIPGAFIATFASHAIFFLISNSETSHPLHVFSAANVAVAYLLTSLWAGVFSIAVTYTVLLWTKKIDRPDDAKIWRMVVLCVLALLEVFILAFIATKSHKERKRLRYAEKWKWRPGAIGFSSSQWSIGKLEPGGGSNVGSQWSHLP